MGRSYWFECPRCDYRAKVSGRPDRGRDFFVTTILCRDCKRLYDVVTRMRWPEAAPRPLGANGFGVRPRLSQHTKELRAAPAFEAALNRLRAAGARRYKWLSFPVQCPVSAMHRVQSWNDPDKCPRCGTFLEKGALPYQIWD